MTWSVIVTLADRSVDPNQPPEDPEHMDPEMDKFTRRLIGTLKDQRLLVSRLGNEVVVRMIFDTTTPTEACGIAIRTARTCAEGLEGPPSWPFAGVRVMTEAEATYQLNPQPQPV